jgi:hypothetical protein
MTCKMCGITGTIVISKRNKTYFQPNWNVLM